MNQHLLVTMIPVFVAYLEVVGGTPSMRRTDEGREHMSMDDIFDLEYNEITRISN